MSLHFSHVGKLSIGEKINGRDLIKKGFGTGSDQVDVFAVGLNWYLNNMVLIRLNYLHNSFDDKLGRLKDDNEDVFLSRFQVEF